MHQTVHDIVENPAWAHTPASQLKDGDVIRIDCGEWEVLGVTELRTFDAAQSRYLTVRHDSGYIAHRVCSRDAMFWVKVSA